MPAERTEGPVVANPDPNRGKQPGRNPKPEVPELNVQSLEDAGSMIALDPDSLDPEFSYRWVNVDPRKIGRAKARGYVYVKSDEGIMNTVGDSPEVKDGRYYVMDVVLMKCRVDVRKARRRKNHKRTQARLKGPERKFRKEAAQESQRYSERIEVITDKE